MTIGARLYAPLSDGDISLAPLAEQHRDQLRAACAQDGEIWRLYATSFDPKHFEASFDGLIESPAKLAYAIFDGDRLAGMTAWLGLDEARAVVEIGNTYIAPALRGSGFNGRLKRLMLDHAFAGGIRRVEFRVDARNGRSQAAMLKVGGVREGVLRADRVTWTGHVRDTVLFSILADEWRDRAIASPAGAT